MNLVKFYVDSLDVSTRGKRRNAVKIILMMLEKVRNAEDAYLERIPLNLQNGEAYAMADCSIDIITDAIVFLSDAY